VITQSSEFKKTRALKTQNSSTIRGKFFFFFFCFKKKHVGIAFGQEKSYFTFSFNVSVGPSKVKKAILTVI
jgi:hypothetical protein